MAVAPCHSILRGKAGKTGCFILGDLPKPPALIPNAWRCTTGRVSLVRAVQPSSNAACRPPAAPFIVRNVNGGSEPRKSEPHEWMLLFQSALLTGPVDV